MLLQRMMVEGPAPSAQPLPYHLELVGSIWRHRLLFAAIFLGVFLLSIVAAFTIPSKYMATGSVIVAEPDPAMVRSSDAWSQKLGDPADLESQIMILKSPRLLKLAVQQPGTYDAVMAECRASGDSKCLAYQPDSNELTEYVASRYSVGAAGRSRVLEMSYSSPLPATAKTMANALVESYLEDQKNTLSDGREIAAKWLWQELADLDKDIRERDAKIEAYRRDNGLVRGATAPISSERLSGIAQQFALAEQAKAQAQARLDAIRDVRNGEDLSSTSNALDSRTVADLKQQIATVRRQLASSGAVLGPRHPQLKMLADSLASLQRQMNDEVEKIAASAQKDYEAAVGQVTALQKRMNAAQTNAATAAADETSIEGMVRDVEVKRQLYAQLYQRASEMETERRSLAGSARLVSLAETPLRPYFPKKTPLMAIGIALGLMLAAAACVLKERFSGVRLMRAVEDGAPVPSKARIQRPLEVIASLPELPTASLLDACTMTLSLTLRRSAASQGMQHALRGLLQELRRLQAGRPLLIMPADTTQSDAAFLALALGQVAARSGLNVLAIECSPMGQDFTTALGLGGGYAGLSDIVGGAADPAKAVVPTATPGLHVIVAGDGGIDLRAKGQKRRFNQLLAWTKPYDLVLLSGPSSLGEDSTSDALSLTEVGLDTLVCVSRDETTEAVLAQVEARLAQSEASAVGAVILPHINRGGGRSDGFLFAQTELA